MAELVDFVGESAELVLLFTHPKPLHISVSYAYSSKIFVHSLRHFGRNLLTASHEPSHLSTERGRKSASTEFWHSPLLKILGSKSWGVKGDVCEPSNEDRWNQRSFNDPGHSAVQVWASSSMDIMLQLSR